MSDALAPLALTADGVLAFEYDDGWIREGFSISPLSPITMLGRVRPRPSLLQRST